MPFDGPEKTIEANVLAGKYSMSTSVVGTISEQAKDFLKGLLTVDPAKRLTADSALAHAWIAGRKQRVAAPVNEEVVARLQKFAKQSRLEKKLRFVVAQNLTIDEIAKLKAEFAALDTDHTGKLSHQARAARRAPLPRAPARPLLCAALCCLLLCCPSCRCAAAQRASAPASVPLRLPLTAAVAHGCPPAAVLPGAQEVQKFLMGSKDHPKYSDISDMISSLDADADGQIDIMEFTAAALDVRLLLDDEKLRAVFQHMDMNKDGNITMAELMAQLDGDPVVYDLMADGDMNKDGKLSLEEFRSLMKIRLQQAKSAVGGPMAAVGAAGVTSA